MWRHADSTGLRWQRKVGSRRLASSTAATSRLTAAVAFWL